MHKRVLGLAVAVIVGVVLVSASGAATTKAQKVTTINVSTRAAVVDYLRSLHVNAKHAVIQRGFRNYAGAHCPGKHWTCASTRHTVVQIAKQGGQNRFLCTGSKCVVVQISGTAHGVYFAGRIATASPSRSGGNSGYCVKTGSGTLSGGGQTCSISQLGTSGGNTAGIYEVTSKVSGLVQTVQFAASISQSGSGDNTACVTQGISQTGSTSNTNTKPLAVSLEATQSITILQDTATGNNYAQSGANPTTGTCNTSQTLSQSQTQTSTVSANGNITQTLNPAVNSTIPNGGNASLDVEQNQGKTPNSTLTPGTAVGTNSAVFSQTTGQTLIANAKNGATVTQQENQPDGDGTPTHPFSGIVGTVNQDSTGQSTATVTQSETQCEDAANTSNSPALTGCSQSGTEATPTGFTSLHPLSQTENGPVGLLTPKKSTSPIHAYHKGIGTSAQTNAGPNVVDTFTLHQHSFQYSDKPDPDLFVTVSQVNTMQGDCTSSGNGLTAGGTCAADQSATLNSGNGSGITSDGYTAGQIGGTNGPPPLVIFCNNGHESCKPTPPPDPTLTATPPVDLNGDTTATSASFEFTDPARDAKFICKLDGTVQPTPNCGSPSVINNVADGTQPYTGLSLGTHTFQVASVDSSGNPSHFIPLSPNPFSWTIVPPCTIGAGNTPLGYSSMPTDIVHCGPPSQAFEATSTNEFGDEVGLDTAGGTSLQSLTVDLQSYGCGDSGQWNTGATDPCVTTSGEAFTVPGGITATIYSVGLNDTVGSVLATSTINPNIPYRPSADPVNCPGIGGNGDNDTGSKWFDPVANACRYSLSYPVTFTNWSAPLTFTNGEKVIWTVQFNTSDAGYNPIVANMGTQPCNSLDRGCGYDSLNVGTKTFNNAAAYPTLTTAPYAGTDVNEDQAFRSYDDPGYSGNHVSLAAETGWTGFRPLGKIVLAP